MPGICNGPQPTNDEGDESEAAELAGRLQGGEAAISGTSNDVVESNALEPQPQDGYRSGVSVSMLESSFESPRSDQS